jgi:hypothetical protein
MTHKKLVFEQGSSSDVKGETNFSEKLWGQPTRDYGYLISNQLRNESKEYIFAEARRLSKVIILHDRDETSVAEPALGRLAMLVDII